MRKHFPRFFPLKNIKDMGAQRESRRNRAPPRPTTPTGSPHVDAQGFQAAKTNSSHRWPCLGRIAFPTFAHAPWRIQPGRRNTSPQNDLLRAAPAQPGAGLTKARTYEEPRASHLGDPFAAPQCRPVRKSRTTQTLTKDMYSSFHTRAPNVTFVGAWLKSRGILRVERASSNV